MQNRESYKEFKDRQQEEFNKFSNDHIFYAFSKEQFSEGMKKLGLDPEEDQGKIYGLAGTGGFYKKTDAKAVRAMFDRLEKEKQEALANDQTGEGFIYEMFSYELANHEFIITGDLSETLEAIGLTVEEVNANEKYLNGLHKALKEIAGE